MRPPHCAFKSTRVTIVISDTRTHCLYRHRLQQHLLVAHICWKQPPSHHLRWSRHVTEPVSSIGLPSCAPRRASQRGKALNLIHTRSSAFLFYSCAHLESPQIPFCSWLQIDWRRLADAAICLGTIPGMIERKSHLYSFDLWLIVNSFPI